MVPINKSRIHIIVFVVMKTVENLGIVTTYFLLKPSIVARNLIAIIAIVIRGFFNSESSRHHHDECSRKKTYELRNFVQKLLSKQETNAVYDLSHIH